MGDLNGQVTLSSRASPPLTMGGENEKEAYFLTGEEAERRLESRIALHRPIITQDQQQFKWDRRESRPIEQLFRQMRNPGNKSHGAEAIAEPTRVLLCLAAARRHSRRVFGGQR